jgi:uncharacterized protein YdhG (YjbR/CyaY superfamily)
MTVIDDLLAGTSPAHRAELERIRQIVHTICPDAEEVKTYGMPGFKYKGKYLLSFAAFKDHMSLFPGGEPSALLEDKLQAYRRSKGTIQFTVENPIPEELLVEIIELCKARNDS